MTDTVITFADHADAAQFFDALDYKMTPARFQPVLAAHGYDDDGRKIITFARQHLADRLTYTLMECPA